MPYTIIKSGKGYKVMNTKTHVTYEKHPISKANAVKQERLLRAIDHGWRPTRR